MSARWSWLILLVVGLAAATSAVNGYEGRWKLADDGSCYWDSTDSGDDQCEGPGPTLGRWKLTPDGGCVWDAEDSGPHQCDARRSGHRDWTGRGYARRRPRIAALPTVVTSAGSERQGPAPPAPSSTPGRKPATTALSPSKAHFSLLAFSLDTRVFRQPATKSPAKTPACLRLSRVATVTLALAALIAGQSPALPTPQPPPGADLPVSLERIRAAIDKPEEHCPPD